MNISLPLKRITDNLSIGINALYKVSNYVAGRTIVDDSHCHDCYEIYFNVSGDVSFLVENDLYFIRAGNIIITRPNEQHHCIYNKDCTHEHFCLWIDANGESDGLFDIFTKREKGKRCCISFNEEERVRAKELFDSIYTEYTKENGNKLCALSDLFTLLSLLTEAFEKDLPTQKLPDPLGSAIAYIDAHLNEKCIGENLASGIYISRSTLYRLFNENLGITPARYIEAKRMSLAKTLLREGKTLSEICLACGYSSPSHFVSVFKKRFGTTPRKYENTH